MNRRVSVRIRYRRRSNMVALLVLAVLVAAWLGYLAWGQQEVAASSLPAPLAASTGMRQYYLTTTAYDGVNADGSDGNGAGVCASGYHFASLWEILDAANLKYNTMLGATQVDAGQGPPSDMEGWVRTGYAGDVGTTPGEANCSNWTSAQSIDHGTSVKLAHDWSASNYFHVWEANWAICLSPNRVWCAEDYGTGISPVYLPIIMKNQ
jgi:hypothetical protein